MNTNNNDNDKDDDAMMKSAKDEGQPEGAKKDDKETADNGIGDDDDDEEEELDEEQIEEYNEKIEELGSFPDKRMINNLSEIASDYADARKPALQIYECIKKPLINTTDDVNQKNRKLPLVYVIDSILKNVKGSYIPIIEEDAKQWLPLVYQCLEGDDAQRSKLQRVWNTWREFQIFSTEAAWKEMGACFLVERNNNNNNNNSSSSNNNSSSINTTTNTRNDSGTSAAAIINTANDLTSAKQLVAEAKAKVTTGIAKMPDGTLKLSTSLRKQMQLLLDEAQSGVAELDRVSLERLSDINPDLLLEIKVAAEDILSSISHTNHSSSTAAAGGGIGAADNGTRGGKNKGGRDGSASSSGGGGGGASSAAGSIFYEPRTVEQIAESNDWNNLTTSSSSSSHHNYLEQSNELIGKLQHYVRLGTTTSAAAPSSSMTMESNVNDISNKISMLATASCTASLLTSLLLMENDQQDNNKNKNNKNSSILLSSFIMDQAAPPPPPSSSAVGAVVAALVDVTQFTNEGIKTKNENVIASLYHAGLPFVSSADGRRFATQKELSAHLDALFKKSQLEKSTEHGASERDWYTSISVWCKDADAAAGGGSQTAAAQAQGAEEEKVDPEKVTVLADEARDKCVICGINFKMFFDNEEGQYKYSNCYEVDVLGGDITTTTTTTTTSDETSTSEPMLVHATCLRGLGSPEVLRRDQILQIF